MEGNHSDTSLSKTQGDSLGGFVILEATSELTDHSILETNFENKAVTSKLKGWLGGFLFVFILF